MGKCFTCPIDIQDDPSLDVLIRNNRVRYRNWCHKPAKMSVLEQGYYNCFHFVCLLVVSLFK